MGTAIYPEMVTGPVAAFVEDLRARVASPGELDMDGVAELVRIGGYLAGRLLAYVEMRLDTGVESRRLVSLLEQSGQVLGRLAKTLEQVAARVPFRDEAAADFDAAIKSIAETLARVEGLASWMGCTNKTIDPEKFATSRTDLGDPDAPGFIDMAYLERDLLGEEE